MKIEKQCDGIGRVVDDDFTGETIPCETCGGAAVGQRSVGTNAEARNCETCSPPPQNAT